VQPVVTVAEMRAADAAAPVPEETLVRRAGTAAAVAALRMLGGTYGMRVVVVAGKGNNGADGRVAAGVLRARGARVSVVAPGAAIRDCDLVVDAALGTGLRGAYDAPGVPPGAQVLAVDIPSGVDGDTGAAPGRPMVATRTVTFAAWKPGLLQGDGPRFAGAVEVADIGLGELRAGAALVEDDDVARLVPLRAPRSHKWETAVCVVAGSPGMEGAATLAATGASRAGAGMVRLGLPGSADVPAPGAWPTEAVRFALPARGWGAEVLGVLERCRALVIGPGIGRSEDTVAEIRAVVAAARVPVVVDADALFALGDAATAREIVAGSRPVVVTPHDREYARLLGADPGPDRLDAARRLAAATGAVALVKGSLTAVASPSGEVRLAAAGSPRLATAGTGDVLSGVIGAFCARGMTALDAAALAAHVHGRAASDGRAEGLVAGDLPHLISARLSAALGPGTPPSPHLGG